MWILNKIVLAIALFLLTFTFLNISIVSADSTPFGSFKQGRYSVFPTVDSELLSFYGRAIKQGLVVDSDFRAPGENLYD